MEADRRRWDERYEGATVASPRPPDVLDGADELLALLPSGGTAIDIACGAGAQSMWLAGLGYDVVALDVSPVAIELTRSAAAAQDLAGRIDARAWSTSTTACRPTSMTWPSWSASGSGAAGSTGRSIDVLRPGGVADRHRAVRRRGRGQPGEFHAPAGELFDAFTRPDAEIVHHTEEDGLASIVVVRRR